MSRKVKFAFKSSICAIILIITFSLINKGVTIKNNVDEKTATIINEVTPYEVEYVYDSTLASDADAVVISEGVNGLKYTYDGLNYKTVSTVKNKVVKVGTGKSATYNGKLTSYGADCKGCSKEGNVSCMTREGKKHSLTHDGIYYKDTTYGNVRILAADNSGFPCGTVVKVNNGKEEFTGIVLDTGSSMRTAWNNGTVWLDLAFATQAEAKAGGMSSNNAKFVVQRWGW